MNGTVRLAALAWREERRGVPARRNAATTLAAAKCATGVEKLDKKRSVATRRLPETLPGLLCSISAKRGPF